MTQKEFDALKYSIDPIAFMKEILGLKCEWFHQEWLKLFEDNNFISLLAPRGHGKEEDINTPILTPNGWKKMGDLLIGDYVIGSDGKPTKVIGVYPQGVKEVYKVETSDGRSTRCGKEHLWTVQTPSNTKDKFITKTTLELSKNYKSKRFDKRNGKHYIEYRHFIPTVSPIEFEEKKLLIEPYTLGAWLGDGDSNGNGFTTADEEILRYLNYEITSRKRKYRYGLIGLKTHLKELGLINNKSIPEEYLFASKEQRIALLQGLMDTDGNNQTDGHVFEFNNSNYELINGVLALIRSLGGTGKLSERYTSYSGSNNKFKSYRITGKVPKSIIPFRLKRKIEQWKGSLKTRSSIINISKDGYAECQCIQVENEDGLYITKDYLLTHNTVLVSSYLTWKIVQDPDIRILTVTINQDKANEMMSLLQSALERNERLIEIFGQQKGYSDWSRSTLRVMRAGRSGKAHKEPTFTVVGVTASMVGGHYDIIILDDITDQNNSRTEHRRRDLVDWYNSTLTPMLEPEGKIISIGTRWHESDIHTYLQKLPNFESKIYKAILDDENKEVLWPEQWTYDKLMERKYGMGSLSFQMQYQNEIISHEDSPIKREWVENSINKYKMIPQPFETFMGVDLSSKGEETDYFTITIIGIHEGMIYILDGLRTKASLFKQFELIKSYDSKWQPSKIGIEQAAQQKMIVDQLVESTTLPIIPIKSSIVSDRMSRVQRLSVLFETGRVYLNPNLEDWANEMIYFPRGSHDDTIDSLSFAIQASQSDEEEHKIDWTQVKEMIVTRKDVGTKPIVKRDYRITKI